METPETEHQARIRKLLEESDQKYEAELKRQNSVVLDGEETVEITKLPLANNLENS